MHFDVKLQPVLINPDQNCIWINIPKNASSFIQTILTENGWVEPDPSIRAELLESDIRKFCILRNPLERWVSGFAECFMDLPEICDLLNNPIFIKVIERNPVFDNHTELQSSFVKNTTNLEYILLESNVDAGNFFRTIEKWITKNNGTADCKFWRNKVNPYDNDNDKHYVYWNARKLMQENKSFQDSLNKFYISDFHLLDKAKKVV